MTNLAGLMHESDCCLSVVISDAPSAALAGPVSIAQTTRPDRIAISFNEPATGGSPITNFEVQMDDGIGGGFTVIAGGDDATYSKT